MIDPHDINITWRIDGQGRFVASHRRGVAYTGGPTRARVALWAQMLRDFDAAKVTP